ncbi:MAG: hydroxyisourate hydrolase [Natronospirillum sp.]
MNTGPKSPITTHVLELGTGLPATGVAVTLCQITHTGTGIPVVSGETDADGRLMNWFNTALAAGRYRLTFATGAWYAAQGKDTFYPEISLDFQVNDPDVHYHVPLLLNQWGYSTYRGS